MATATIEQKKAPAKNPNSLNRKSPLERTRNIGIAAHIDAGKTTITERVLPQSEPVWRQATKYNVPRLAFINKMDRVGADFEMSVDSIHKKLGANAWPVLLPLGKEDQLRGQLDVINKTAIIYSENDQLGSIYEVTDVPKEYVNLVDKAYNDLVEHVSNIDDDVAEAVIHEKPVTPELLKAGI